MKPLLILIRIIVVGLLWSIFFMESTRVIMLRNWHFDILNREHWKIAWDLWSTTWVISEPKEWAFVLIIISFIPLWFTGWIALSMVSWGKFIYFIITLPWRIIKNIFYRPVKVISTPTEVTPVTKRASYKEIRPKSIRPVQPYYTEQPTAAPQTFTNIAPAVAPQPTPVRTAAPVAPQPSNNSAFNHPLFNFDESEEDLDFDIDSFDVSPKKSKTVEKSAPPQNDFEEPSRPVYNPNKNRQDNRRYNDDEKYSKNNRGEENTYSRHKPQNNREQNRTDNDQQRRLQQKSNNSCAEIIKDKGFEIFNRLTIKNTIIDHLAISANRIYLCMLDREPGDWLADEERFNDEEPLWFSENSHRISPVRKLEIAKQIIENRLSEADMNFTIEPILIEQIGNIINAEDMLEIWESMDIKVCRIDRGMPKELPVFARVLPEAGKPISSGKFDKLINIIRNIG